MDDSKALKVLNPKSVWLPILLGLCIVAYLAYQDDQFSAENLRKFQDFSLTYLLLLLLVILFKDGLNSFRVSLISHQEISLYPALRVVLLWEFAIAVTPPVLGAAAVLIFIIFKEGQPLGKAIAYALLLATLDNLFFLTASPLAFWVSSGEILPQVEQSNDLLSESIPQIFWFSYFSIALYTLFMLSALLLFPKTVRNLLEGLMNFKGLRRWKASVMKQSDELVMASQVLKGQSFFHWLKLLLATYGVWILKYAIVNVWINGFQALTLGDHLLMIGRHVALWLVMLVSPSPGNAGTAEFIYPIFYQEFAGGYTFTSSILWRLSTYYPYLIVGVLLLPKWWKK